MAKNTQEKHEGSIYYTLDPTEPVDMLMPRLSKFEYIAVVAMQGLLANPTCDPNRLRELSALAAAVAQEMVTRLSAWDEVGKAP